MPNSTKQKILEVAGKLFYEQGYNQTGINQIIAQSQVAKASFYYHFKSKQLLALAYLEATNKELDSQMQAMNESPLAPRETLLDLFAQLKSWLKSPDFRGCAFLKLSMDFPSGDRQIQGLVIAQKNNFRNFLKGLLTQITDLPKKRLDTNHLADVLVILFDGAAAESVALGLDWPIDAAIETATFLLQAGESEGSHG